MKILSIATGFICAALLCGKASAAETDYAAGTQALPLLQANGTARAMAMGSAVVAVPQGSASLLWNPAGLSQLGCTEIGVHHNSGLGDTIQETVILGMPVGDIRKDCKGGTLGGFAAAVGYVDYGNFSGRDNAGSQTAGYVARDFSGSLGYGRELMRGFSAGLAMKNNLSQVPNETYSTYAADLGVLWTVVRSLDLGVTYSNINLGSQGNSIGDVASGWRLGAGWTVDKHLLLAASGELQNKGVNRLQLGGEYLVGNTEGKANVLALRAGYQINYPDAQLTGLTGLTLGLGYTLSRSVTLDYAMVPSGDLGTSHRLSLTVKFDCPEKPRHHAVVVAVVAPKAAAPAAAVAVNAMAPVEPEPVVLKEYQLEDSHFDFDSAVLRPEGMEALRENVQFLKDNPNALVNVAGYTSRRGTEEYNQKLSERRAAAVAEYLTREGIAPGRITTIGYGETRPAEYEATNAKDTEAAKANKRVVSTVTDKPAGVELGDTTIKTIKQ